MVGYRIVPGSELLPVISVKCGFFLESSFFFLPEVVGEQVPFLSLF